MTSLAWGHTPASLPISYPLLVVTVTPLQPIPPPPKFAASGPPSTFPDVDISLPTCLSLALWTSQQGRTSHIGHAFRRHITGILPWHAGLPSPTSTFTAVSLVNGLVGGRVVASWKGGSIIIPPSCPYSLHWLPMESSHVWGQIYRSSTFNIWLYQGHTWIKHIWLYQGHRWLEQFLLD